MLGQRSTGRNYNNAQALLSLGIVPTQAVNGDLPGGEAFDEIG